MNIEYHFGAKKLRKDIYWKRYRAVKKKLLMIELKARRKRNYHNRLVNKWVYKHLLAAEFANNIIQKKRELEYNFCIELKYTIAEPSPLDGNKGLLCSWFGCGSVLSNIEKLAGGHCTQHMGRSRKHFAYTIFQMFTFFLFTIVEGILILL